MGRRACRPWPTCPTGESPRGDGGRRASPALVFDTRVSLRVRYAYFDDEGTAHRMSQARFDRVHDREFREPVPELAGRRVRFLVLFVWFEDRVPVEVTQMDAWIITFDSDGRRDLAVADRQLQAAVETVDETILARSDPAVIAAAGRFKTAGYRWKPTTAQVEAAITVHRLRGDR